jgi:hypothetical protein
MSCQARRIIHILLQSCLHRGMRRRYCETEITPAERRLLLDNAFVLSRLFKLYLVLKSHFSSAHFPQSLHSFFSRLFAWKLLILGRLLIYLILYLPIQFPSITLSSRSLTPLIFTLPRNLASYKYLYKPTYQPTLSFPLTRLSYSWDCGEDRTHFGLDHGVFSMGVQGKASV